MKLEDVRSAIGSGSGSTGAPRGSSSGALLPHQRSNAHVFEVDRAPLDALLRGRDPVRQLAELVDRLLNVADVCAIGLGHQPLVFVLLKLLFGDEAAFGIEAVARVFTDRAAEALRGELEAEIVHA